MRALIQRVSEAAVTIGGKKHAQIMNGLLVLIGIGLDDTQEDGAWLARKISSLRLFDDEAKVMNLSVNEVKGEVLVISQFTLHAKTRKGSRPSYIKAAGPDVAIPLYESFIDAMHDEVRKSVKSGIFGADMQVSLINDGPVTIWMDTKNKE